MMTEGFPRFEESDDWEEFPDVEDTDLNDIMSTIKKHLTSDAKHVLPSYRKLPPIPSPPPYSGLTITKISKNGTSPSRDESVTSSNQNFVYDHKTAVLEKSSKSPPNDVKLIGYKSLDEQKRGYIPPGSELPPCRICGIKASGLHYGVNTCEACKAFFRRTLKKSSIDFQCTCSPADRQRNLEDPPRKTSCARCRYDRCLKEGMSKDAIKIGRYTINRKRQNDREVNMLKEQGGVVGRKISESSPKSSTSSVGSPSSSQNVTSPEVMSPDTTTKSESEDSNMGVGTKRLKTNDGKALVKGFLDSLHNSLYEKLLQCQNKTNPGADYTHLEKLYMQPFIPENEPSKFKSTIQIGKDGHNVGPVSGTQPAVIQKGGKTIRPALGPRSGGKVLSGKQLELVQTVQNTSVSSSQQRVEQNPHQTLLTPQTSPLVTTSGQEAELGSQREGKSLIETLFEAGDTVPIENEASAIENLLAKPVVLTPAKLKVSQNQSVNMTHTTFHPSQTVNPSHGKLINNSTISEDSIGDFLNAENMFSVDSLNFPPGNPSDVEIASKLKSMQELQRESEESMDSITETLHLNDAEIASKLKSMEAHILEDEDLIASKLKSMEQHDFEETADFSLLNGDQIHADDPSGIASKLDSMSKQYDVDCEQKCKGNSPITSPMLSSVDLAEFEMYQPQTGLPAGPKPKMPVDMEEMKRACQMMVDTALASYVCPLKLSCDEIKERHKAYLEQYMLKTSLFGDMNNIPEDEYLEFYNQTGIDIDNRQEILIDYLKYAEQCISELVTFSKVIPGFTDLPLDDQVTLLKGARFSTIMIKDGLYGGQCQATAYQVATTPWNKDYHFNELKKIAPIALFDMKAEIYEKVFELGMTVEESIIVKAMAITYPKSEDLQAQDQVEAIHNNMTECLIFILQKRKTGKKPSLTSIFELLFYLREKSVKEQLFMVEMFEKWPLTNNHQLLKEFVS